MFVRSLYPVCPKAFCTPFYSSSKPFEHLPMCKKTTKVLLLKLFSLKTFHLSYKTGTKILNFTIALYLYSCLWKLRMERDLLQAIATRAWCLQPPILLVGRSFFFAFCENTFIQMTGQLNSKGDNSFLNNDDFVFSFEHFQIKWCVYSQAKHVYVT